ncbi:hypothetical protein DTL21_12855 [Bremerella cremea]|uniref:Uncharacterized protein n=1 Tax=Blastopirellula marina TaxID=124 RepID=A0A2S8FQS7_9BACT|nr:MULTISPECIES: hypothetical protein [Pirellulaceae]PQO34410.1 hypothetical protein C5Y83_12850 [Blastopirellula marina]RCS46906.1 hypothetical protein DTL21_12855 [Bremerella cremea]
MKHGRYRISPQSFSGILPLLLLCLLLLGNSGCVGLLAALLSRGDYQPARFDGLAEKKVAVLCVAGPSFYSETSTSRRLAEQVEGLLVSHIEDVSVVSQQKIDDWKDRSGWDSVDYREAGKALGADMVVAIDLVRFEIQPNPGVYKGTAEYVINVYDIHNNGEVVFRDSPKAIEFPTNGIMSSTGNEREFRSSFMQLISHRIARNFYKYNVNEDLMLDESFISR